MKTKHIIFSLIIVSIIALIVIKPRFKCNGNDQTNDTVATTDTVIITDTVSTLETLKVQGPDRIVYVDIPYQVDTAEILKRYFAHVYRNDTLRNDSGLFIRLEEEISENDVINRILEVKDYEQTKIITHKEVITVTEHLPAFYAGPYLGMTAKVPTFGMSFSFVTAKQRILTGYAGYPALFMVGMQFPFKSKKQ